MALFVLSLWLSRFVTVSEYFERTFELGWYPPEGDAIAIPIAGNAILTVFGVPPLLLLLWLALRRYPSRVRLFAWSNDRLFSSIFWTTLLLPLLYFELDGMVEAARLRLPLGGAAHLGWIAAWILLRAILVSRALDVRTVRIGVPAT